DALPIYYALMIGDLMFDVCLVERTAAELLQSSEILVPASFEALARRIALGSHVQLLHKLRGRLVHPGMIRNHPLREVLDILGLTFRPGELAGGDIHLIRGHHNRCNLRIRHMTSLGPGSYGEQGEACSARRVARFHFVLLTGAKSPVGNRQLVLAPVVTLDNARFVRQPRREPLLGASCGW